MAWLAGLLPATGCQRINCKDLEREAEALLESSQSCEVDADCTSGPSIECLHPCGTVLNKDTDLDAFRQQARDIGNEYKDSCGCTLASCIDRSDWKLRCVDNACTSTSD